MRLHRLAVTAFGPFGATQEVDFDALSSAGLFLLHGPTGAGKTSVLDAVCFGLYGAVPGARQSPGTSLRSDHAPAGLPTEVRLELTVGGRRLEVTRRPAQPRPKKKREGFTTERAQSWLREYDAESGWRALSRSHQEIGEEISQLVGMNRDQFCQVVLLPQGDFARFLRADAEARGKLLGRLFDTRRFAAVEERLAELRRRAEAQVTAADERILAVAQRIAQAAGPAGLEAAFPDAQPGEPGLAEGVLEWAAVARGGARERFDIARCVLSAAEQRQAAARVALDTERELTRLQQRYEETRRRADALEADRVGHDQDRDRLESARKADLVTPALTLRETAERTRRGTGEARERSRALLPAPLADAGAGQLATRERELRQELGALEAARRAERRSAAIDFERAELERQSRADDALIAEAAGWLADWEASRKELADRIGTAQEAATRAEQLAGRLGPARGRLEAARRRDALAARIADAKDRLTAAREEAAAAHENWLGLRERRLRSIAAELAAELVAGAPCTVCGSADHPEPARAEAGHVDRATEEAALAAHRRAEEARTAAESALSAVGEKYAVARAEARGVSLGGEEDGEGEEDTTRGRDAEEATAPDGNRDGNTAPGGGGLGTTAPGGDGTTTPGVDGDTAPGEGGATAPGEGGATAPGEGGGRNATPCGGGATAPGVKGDTTRDRSGDEVTAPDGSGGGNTAPGGDGGGNTPPGGDGAMAPGGIGGREAAGHADLVHGVLAVTAGPAIPARRNGDEDLGPSRTTAEAPADPDPAATPGVPVMPGVPAAPGVSTAPGIPATPSVATAPGDTAATPGVTGPDAVPAARSEAAPLSASRHGAVPDDGVRDGARTGPATGAVPARGARPAPHPRVSPGSFPAPGDDPSVAELEALLGELTHAHESAHRTAAGTHAAREALAAAEREHAERLDDQQRAERRAAARTSQRESLDREQAALSEELATARGGSHSVAERIALLERQVTLLAEAADAVRADEEARRQRQEADDQLAEAVARAGFDSPEAAEAVLLTDAEQRELQRRTAAWQAEAAAVADRLAEADTRAAAHRPPADPDAARAVYDTAERLLRNSATALAAARERCAELDRLAHRATEEVRGLGPLREEYERVARLAGLTAGTSADNERKMRLESYVLAARLEQVAAAATARLARMSSGRYTLVHSDARTGGRRAGLGLHVVDSWTGRERDTATLSGGETFFASLALALGLADVVTDEAGGVRLDTLFIDEGFGSLDGQTLDEVLDVLDSLRERDRSVGIVSHVADLRRRIPVQLEVVKERHGSAVRQRATDGAGR